MRRLICVLGLSVLVGCGGESIDTTPERQDGTESREFEADDIERAENASEAVKAYCKEGTVSEAQYVGCLSHVTEDDIP